VGGSNERRRRAEGPVDFGSLNAYLSARVISDIERRTATNFDYVLVLLGPKAAARRE